MDKVNIYMYTTIKGPGAREGSYTYILEYITGKGPVTLTKQDSITATENRAHLLILIKALERLKHPCELEIHTDSEYIRSGAVKWLKDWERRGWVTKKGQARGKQRGVAAGAGAAEPPFGDILHRRETFLP